MFGARFVFMQEVDRSATNDSDGRLVATLSEGATVSARARRPRDRRRVSPPRDPRARGSGRRGRLLRRRGLRRAADVGPGRLRARRGELCRAGGAPSRAVRPAPDARRACAALEAGMSHYLVRQLEATPNVDDQARNGDRRRGRRRLADASRPARPGERCRGDGRRRRALPLDRGPPAHGMAPRRDLARQPGLRPHGRRRPAGHLAARARPAPARDEHAARPRGRRCPARIGQARRVGGRRRLDRDPGRPPPARGRRCERAGGRAGASCARRRVATTARDRR